MTGDPTYTHFCYNLKTGRIHSGWCYRADALEAKADDPAASDLRVYTRAGLHRLRVDPDNSNHCKGAAASVHNEVPFLWFGSRSNESRRSNDRPLSCVRLVLGSGSGAQTSQAAGVASVWV